MRVFISTLPPEPERHGDLVRSESPLDPGQGVNEAVVELQIFPAVGKSDGRYLVLTLAKAESAANAKTAFEPALTAHIQTIFALGKIAAGDLHVDGGVLCVAGQAEFVDRRHFIRVRRRERHVGAVGVEDGKTETVNFGDA